MAFVVLVLRKEISTTLAFFAHSPEEVLRPGPEHELLVDLHVELGALGLQLAPARRGAGIRALKEMKKKTVVVIL